MGKCKFPSCNKKSRKTWALVDLCKEHYQDIWKETQKYYNGKGSFQITYDDRLNYFSIAHLIPWRRKVKV